VVPSRTRDVGDHGRSRCVVIITVLSERSHAIIIISSSISSRSSIIHRVHA